MPSKNYTMEQFASAVASSTSLAETLRKIGVRPTGGNYSVAYRNIRKLGLNTSHWLGMGYSRGRHYTDKQPSKPLNDILVTGSNFTNMHKLKYRVFAAGLLENKCQERGLPPEWQGKPLSLHMDHIDGDRTNNSLDNLRMLCPNCHNQTPTYGSKNIKQTHKPKKTCDCGNTMSPSSKKCASCASPYLKCR